MELKFTDNIINKTATMLLYSEIGGLGVNGEDFAREMKFLLRDPSVSEIDVRINTPGGSIAEGFAIVSAIQNASKPVNTIVDGLAASMGSVIAAVGNKRSIVDFGILMVHDPHVGVDPEELDDETKKVLSTFRESILTIYENNTNISREVASELMGQETWMDASEAINNGFVDNIINTGKNAKIESVENLKCIDIYNRLKPVVNSLNKPISKMQKVESYLNIVEASEDKVLAALKARDSKIENFEATAKELSEVKAELATFKAKDAENKRKEANDLVMSIVSEGKLKNDSEAIELWTNRASEDYEGVKSMFDAIDFKASVKIQTPENSGSSLVPKGREEWGAREWDKNDPKGLENIRLQSPELYKELHDKSYNKKEA